MDENIHRDDPLGWRDNVFSYIKTVGQRDRRMVASQTFPRLPLVEVIAVIVVDFRKQKPRLITIPTANICEALNVSRFYKFPNPANMTAGVMARRSYTALCPFPPSPAPRKHFLQFFEFHNFNLFWYATKSGSLVISRRVVSQISPEAT